MALEVIGAGYPRTGTLSLKTALEALGFAPCHHMTEVFDHPEQWPLWDAVADRRPVDYEALFAGYRASTDAPGCYVWRELAEAFPKAKVILGLREPDAWFKSMQATIFSPSHQAQMAASPVGPTIRKLAMRGFGAGGQAVAPPEGPPGPPDKDVMTAAMQAHNAAVISALPPERLLVYRITEGWGPLCDFLGVPVPDSPFPHVNDSQAFHDIQIPA